MRFLLIAVVTLTVLVAPCRALAEGETRRVAIVIGVSDYGGQGDLANPARDAAATAETLTRLGYDVRSLINPKRAAVDAALDGLASGGPIDQLVFYFSGHGGRADGDSVLALGERDPATKAQRSLSLSALIGRFAKLKVTATAFVLDACRTNVKLKGAKTAPGLAPPPRAPGSFFAYAAAPGELAYDSAGRALSPFTFALVDELLIPNQDIGVVMRKVRERVSRETGGRQTPWSEDGLTGQLVLNAAPAAPELFQLYGKALKGDVVASRELGLAYLNGQGVAADVERGSALLESAAARKDAAAMLALGAFEAGRDQNALRSGGRAREWYAKAAAAGSPDGMYRLAELDAKATPAGKKPSDATLALYRRAMEAGHADAAARYLGLNLTFRFDKTLNRAATIAALRTNAAAGNLASMTALGRIYAQPKTDETDFREADFWLDKAAARGSAEALLEQSKLFALGRGRPADPVRAYELTRQAAERGSGEAMLFVGRQLQQGTGVAADPAAAVPWFRRATAAGETEAFADLGHAVEVGLGTDLNLAEAVVLYRRGAELRDPVSTRSLAVMYEQGLGVRKNMDRAIGYYVEAAELGDGRAEASLAVLAANGMLTSSPDPARGAAALKEVTARTADADYTYKLAQMTEKGVGRPADPVEAAKLYKRAADLGSATAMAELAALYKLGIGVPKDIDRATELWKQAAVAGDPESYYNLAVSYRERGSGPEDQAESGRWARRGAEAGNGEAMTLHARNLYFGEAGQTRDVDQAFDWLTRSLSTGNGWAAGTLVALATDDKLEAPQADRDRALLTLVKAVDRESNAAAAEALRLIYQAREGVDMRSATQEALERRLDGPQRGMAALLLGLGFREGRFGGKPDGVEAARWFSAAIEAGEAEAYRHLGDLNADDSIPNATPEAAFLNYKAGAERGEPGAINNLGVAYRTGLGVPQNLDLAFQNFKRAAERGYPSAMHNLGVAYQLGLGIAPSGADAEIWYERAISAGFVGARFGLANVLLNAPEAERDYTRALFNLVQLGFLNVPAAAISLDEISRNATLPQGVRERAVAMLALLQGSNPRTGAPAALKKLVADGVVKTSGKSYALRDVKR